MQCPACWQKSDQHHCASCVRSLVGEQRAHLDAQRLETAKLGQAVSCSLAAQAQRRLSQSLLDALRGNVAKYRSLLLDLSSRARSETDALRERKARLRERRRSLAAAQSALRMRHGTLLGQNGLAGAMLEGLTMQLEDICERVGMERKKLVMQLVDLFPIDSAGPGEETIARLGFPASLKQMQAMNEDARAAVIAIVIRVLLIASSYLSLTLPFKMEFLGCKASIGRWGANETQTVLVGAGSAMENGLAMLRKNVEALCFYQGIPQGFVKDWSLLHCLWQSFHSPSLGNPIHQSLLEAESRVGRVPAGRRLRDSLRNTSPITDRKHIPEQEELNFPHSRLQSVEGMQGSSPVSKEKPIHSFLSDLQDQWDTELDDAFVDDLDDDINNGEGNGGGSGGGDTWDFIERPQPPKPSKDEDILHWVSSGAI